MDKDAQPRRIDGVSSRKPQAFGRGRTCSEVGCGVVLSRYNPGDRCSAHHEWPDPPPRRRSRGAAAAGPAEA